MLKKTPETIIKEKINGAFKIPILNIKVKVMKIHQSSNIMKRLDHIWVT